MKTPFSRPGRSGATAIEYGLIASLIGVAIVLGAATLGGKIHDRAQRPSSHQPVASEAMADTRQRRLRPPPGTAVARGNSPVVPLAASRGMIRQPRTDGGLDAGLPDRSGRRSRRHPHPRRFRPARSTPSSPATAPRLPASSAAPGFKAAAGATARRPGASAASAASSSASASEADRPPLLPGRLATALPAGRLHASPPASPTTALATLAFALGAYRYTRYREREPRRAPRHPGRRRQRADHPHRRRRLSRPRPRSTRPPTPWARPNWRSRPRTSPPAMAPPIDGDPGRRARRRLSR